MQRLRIEEVQQVTSNDTQRSQIFGLKSQVPVNSYCNANGMTKIATHKSDIANDT